MRTTDCLQFRYGKWGSVRIIARALVEKRSRYLLRIQDDDTLVKDTRVYNVT
jgi:hypothetical protein